MVIINQNQYQFTISLLLAIILKAANANNCSFGHFTNNAGQCIECLTTCSQCKDLTNQCFSCSQGQFLSNQPSSCLNCPLGQLVCNGSIVECSPHYKLIDKKCLPVCLVNNCRTCTNIYTNSCSVCQQGYFLNSASNTCTLNNRNLQVETFGVNIEPNVINESRGSELNSELPQSGNAIQNSGNQLNSNSPLIPANPQLNNQLLNQSNNIQLNSSNNQNQQDINSIEPSFSTSPQLTSNSSQAQGFSSFPNTNSQFQSFPNSDLSFNSEPLIETSNQPINQNISSVLSTNQLVNQLQPTDLPIIQPNSIPIIQPTDIPPLGTLSLQPDQTNQQNQSEVHLGIDSEGSIQINSNGSSSIIDLNKISVQNNESLQSNNTNNMNSNISIGNNSEFHINNGSFSFPSDPTNIQIPPNTSTNTTNVSNQSNIGNNSTSIQEQDKNTTNLTPTEQNQTITNQSVSEVNKTGEQIPIPFNSNSNTDTLENNGTTINGSISNSSSSCGIGLYFDLARNSCLPCYSKCRTCYKNADQCLECAQGWQKQGWKCVTNELLYYNLTLTPNRTSNGVESYISQFKNSFLTTFLPQTYQNQNSSILTLSSANYNPQTNALTLQGLVNKLPSINITNFESSVNEKFKSLSKIGSFEINNFSLSSSKANTGEEGNSDEGRNRNNSNSNLASILIPSIIGGLIVLAFFSILLCYCCKICCFKQVNNQGKTYNAAPVSGTQRHFVERHQASGDPDRYNYQPQVSGAPPSSSLSKHTSALSDKITVIQFEMVPQNKQSVVKNIYESNLEDQIVNHIKN